MLDEKVVMLYLGPVWIVLFLS